MIVVLILISGKMLLIFLIKEFVFFEVIPRLIDFKIGSEMC